MERSPDSRIVIEGDDHAFDGLVSVGADVPDVAHVSEGLPHYRIARSPLLELNDEQPLSVLAYGENIDRACIRLALFSDDFAVHFI